MGAKVSGPDLGSATKPGEFLAADLAEYTFYAVFSSSGVPAAHARSARPLATATATVRPDKATFPGTYDTFISGAEDQTLYNSDNTWSMPGGFCNAGTYLSFKVKNGTKVTWTDIQAVHLGGRPGIDPAQCRVASH